MRYMINIIVKGNLSKNFMIVSACYLGWNILFMAISAIMQQIIIPRNTEKLHKEMQLEIFNKTANLDLAYFDNSEFYDKYNIALQQSDNRALSVLNSFSAFIGSLLCIASLIALITTIDATVFLFVITNVCISFSVNFFHIRVQHDFYKERIRPQRKSGYVQRVFYLREFTQELRLFGSLKFILKEKFSHAISAVQLLIHNYGVKSAKLQILNSISNTLVNFFVVLYLAITTIKGRISIGDFSAGSSSSQQLTSQLLKLLNVFPQLYEHSLYIESYKEFMELPLSIKSGPIAISPNETLSIQLRDVSFGYTPNAQKILHNISLTINPGEKIAFVGENGAGKSTLIKILTRLYEPTNGVILLSGRNISEYDISSYRQCISVVFQNFQVYSFSIAENILMRPLKCPKDEETVINSLKTVGLFDKICSFPDGIYTLMSREFSDSGISLSGGEMQRLAIARAIAQDGSIIILDEPTSGLDPLSEQELLSSLFAPINKKTVILISHRLSNIVSADRIYFFEKGYLKEFGTHKSLIRSNGLYAKMFNMQAQGYTSAGGYKI